MDEYGTIITAMKYGFSAVLLGTGGYGLFEIYRTKRAWRAFLSLPGALSVTLVAVSGLLITADHQRYYEFLNLVKIISGIFTLVYGIYATLNDFYEQDETGRRAMTKVGLVGILLFFCSTVLSIAADYVKNSIQKQEIEERRKYYANIVDKLVVVDKKSGQLTVNFRKFTDQLFLDLKNAQKDVLDTRKTLADREGRIAALEKQLQEAGVSLRRNEKAIGNLQSELGGMRERASGAEKQLADARSNLGEAEKKLETTGNRLARRDGEVSELRRKLEEDQAALGRRDQELRAARDEAARIKQEVVGLQQALESDRKQLARLGRVQTDLGRREGENEQLKKQLDQVSAQAGRAEKELERTRERLAGRLSEVESLQQELVRQQKESVAVQKRLADAFERLRPRAPRPESTVPPKTE